LGKAYTYLSMRLGLLFLCVAGAAARSSLASLKSKVLRGEDAAMISSTNFVDGTGVISLTVAKEGVQVPLPAFLQKAAWMEIGSEQNVLLKAGFKYWMPQKDGFLFKDAEDTQRTSCVNSKVDVSGGRVEMSFTCEKLNQEDARFKAQPYPIGYRQGLSNMLGGTGMSGYGSGMNGMGYGAGMNGNGYGAGMSGYGGNSMANNNYMPVSSLASPYANSQFSTFWMPVTNGSPYGWNDYNWGAFNYDYYAVTPMGYWGCPGLSSAGTCSSNPYYYPFNP